MNSGKSKIFFLGCFAILCVFILSGCSDSRYTSEKLYWQAERQVEGILKNKAGKLKEEDYNRIISAYRRVAQVCPLEPLAAKAQFVIANLYISQGKYAEAQKEFRHTIQNFSSNSHIAPLSYFSIGKLFEMQSKWTEAREEYEKIIDIYPLSSLGLKIPGYILQHYQKINDKAETENFYRFAVRNYQKLLDEYSGTSMIPVISDALAAFHYTAGKVEKAMEVWDKIVSDYPQSQEAVRSFFIKAGVYENELKDALKAIDVYEEFARQYPQKNNITAEAQLKLAALYFSNKELAKAEETFSGILESYPDNENLRVNAYLGLVACYREKGNTDKAMQVYAKIRREYPDSDTSMAVPFLIAEYYRQANNEQSAEKSTIDAIGEYKNILADESKKDEIKKAAAGFLALCYVKNKDYDAAVSLLREMVNKYPDNPMYLLDIAAIYRSQKAEDKAVEVYNEIIKKYAGKENIVNLAQAQIKSLSEKKKPE